MTVAIAGMLDVRTIKAPVFSTEALQRLDELDGPGQRAARRRAFQMRQHRRRPGVYQRQHVGFAKRLRFALLAQAHPAAHLPRRVISERHAADAPAHGQKARELRRDVAYVGQLLAMLDRRDTRRSKCLHGDRRRARRPEAPLHDRHHLTILYRPQEHLADGLAFTQHFGLETDRYIWRHRTDEGNCQRAHRSPLWHLGTHRLERQRGHQTTEAGASLPPFRRNRHSIRIATHRFKHLGKDHTHLMTHRWRRS